MDGRAIRKQMDEWNRQAASRIKAWNAAGRTDKAMTAIYTPEICSEWDCKTPAEALALDHETLADAWILEHWKDDNNGGAT